MTTERYDGTELIPEWDRLEVPEDDEAEPDDADVDHAGDA